MFHHSLHVWILLVVCVVCSQTVTLESNRAHVTELQTCALKTMKIKIYDPGCEVKQIKTKGCHGYCMSSSMYLLNIQDMRTRCKCCKVKEYRLRFVQLNCPLLDITTKIVTYREATKCECLGCS